MKIHSKARRLRTAIFVLLFGIAFVSCSKVSSDVIQRNSQTLIQEKNQSCDPVWFTVPEENPQCYTLQERLSAAAISGDIPKIQDAIKDGANVNGGYYQSLPVLQQAAMEGRSEAVSYLIDAGASTNFVGDFGQTALTSAVYYGHKETAKVLLRRGADICACARVDPPVLEYAIKSGDQEMVDLLVSASVMNCK
jgi:hypothetical protein